MPKAARRTSRSPVHVTVCADVCPPELQHEFYHGSRELSHNHTNTHLHQYPELLVKASAAEYAPLEYKLEALARSKATWLCAKAVEEIHRSKDRCHNIPMKLQDPIESDSKINLVLFCHARFAPDAFAKLTESPSDPLGLPPSCWKVIADSNNNRKSYAGAVEQIRPQCDKALNLPSCDFTILPAAVQANAPRMLTIVKRAAFNNTSKSSVSTALGDEALLSRATT